MPGSRCACKPSEVVCHHGTNSLLTFLNSHTRPDVSGNVFLTPACLCQFKNVRKLLVFFRGHEFSYLPSIIQANHVKGFGDLTPSSWHTRNSLLTFLNDHTALHVRNHFLLTCPVAPTSGRWWKKKKTEVCSIEPFHQGIILNLFRKENHAMLTS